MSEGTIPLALAQLAPHLLSGLAQGKLGGEQLKRQQEQQQREAAQRALEFGLKEKQFGLEEKELEQKGVLTRETLASRERIAAANQRGRAALAQYNRAGRDRGVLLRIMGDKDFAEMDPFLQNYFWQEVNQQQAWGELPDNVPPPPGAGEAGAPGMGTPGAGVPALPGAGAPPALPGRSAGPSPLLAPLPKLQVPESVRARTEESRARTAWYGERTADIKTDNERMQEAVDNQLAVDRERNRIAANRNTLTAQHQQAQRLFQWMQLARSGALDAAKVANLQAQTELLQSTMSPRLKALLEKYAIGFRTVTTAAGSQEFSMEPEMVRLREEYMKALGLYLRQIGPPDPGRGGQGAALPPGAVQGVDQPSGMDLARAFPYGEAADALREGRRPPEERFPWMRPPGTWNVGQSRPAAPGAVGVPRGPEVGARAQALADQIQALNPGYEPRRITVLGRALNHFEPLLPPAARQPYAQFLRDGLRVEDGKLDGSGRAVQARRAVAKILKDVALGSAGQAGLDLPARVPTGRQGRAVPELPGNVPLPSAQERRSAEVVMERQARARQARARQARGDGSGGKKPPAAPAVPARPAAKNQFPGRPKGTTPGMVENVNEWIRDGQLAARMAANGPETPAGKQLRLIYRYLKGKEYAPRAAPGRRLGPVGGR